MVTKYDVFEVVYKDRTPSKPIGVVNKLNKSRSEYKNIHRILNELERDGFFSQRAESEMLDQTVMEAMVPDLPVLRMAYLIERDFAEFYELAAAKSEGEAREVLTMLATWERGHEKLFKRLHDTAFKEYAEMPWGG